MDYHSQQVEQLNSVAKVTQEEDNAMSSMTTIANAIISIAATSSQAQQASAGIGESDESLTAILKDSISGNYNGGSNMNISINDNMSTSTPTNTSTPNNNNTTSPTKNNNNNTINNFPPK